MTQPKPTAEPWSPETDPDVIARRAAVRKEYGQFVANQPIPWGAVIAYQTGDPVPASNVARYGYEQAGLVARVAQAADFDNDQPATEATADSTASTPAKTAQAKVK